MTDRPLHRLAAASAPTYIMAPVRGYEPVMPTDPVLAEVQAAWQESTESQTFPDATAIPVLRYWTIPDNGVVVSGTPQEARGVLGLLGDALPVNEDDECFYPDEQEVYYTDLLGRRSFNAVHTFSFCVDADHTQITAFEHQLTPQVDSQWIYFDADTESSTQTGGVGSSVVEVTHTASLCLGVRPLDGRPICLERFWVSFTGTATAEGHYTHFVNDTPSS